MPDEPPRRIIIEKSSTVRRRYQRSNKRFKFSAEEIARIERELKAEKRAKELREKEDRRLAKKRKKSEKEARDREERKRLGLPDPNAPKVPSSQPLLSAFLAKRPTPVEEKPVIESSAGDSPDSSAESKGVEDSPAEDTPGHNPPEPGHHSPEPEHYGPEPEDHSPIPKHEREREPDYDHEPTIPITKQNDHDDVALADVESAAGDTEIDSDFDDWDEGLERELSNFQDAGVPEDSKIQDAGHDTSRATLRTICTDRDDDEFSSWSDLDDAELLKTAAAIEINQPAQDTPEVEFLSSSDDAPALPQPSSNHPKKEAPITSVGDSFRDETADCLEEVWAQLDPSFCDLGGA